MNRTKKKIISLLFTFITVTSFSQSKNMKLLGVWNDSTIPVNAGGFRYNEVWGFVQKGREYAVLASKIGTHIIDVTDTTFVEVDRVLGKFKGNVVHRDYHSYNGYLYMVCDEGPSSLQIADLSYLPDSVHVIYDSDRLIIKSHNIFIDTFTNKLYSCGGSNLSGSNDLSIFDISTPSSPQLLTNLGVDVAWWSTVIGYCHDIYVKNDTAYINDGDAMHIVDLTNSGSPIIFGTLSSYPDQGYNHAGYLAPDDTTYVMCDETHGKRVKFVDVSNPLSSINVTDLKGVVSGNASHIPHNPLVHKNYAYVSYYYDGVYVYDISDRNNVKTSGYYDTYPGANGTGFKGCWGVYPFLPSGKILASDMYGGLFVLKHILPPTVKFDTASINVLESSGNVTINVSISHSYEDSAEVIVEIDTASTATQNVDWTSTVSFPLRLKFPKNTTANQSFTITILDDLLIENTEKLIFKLKNVINGELINPFTDTIYILENEFLSLEKNKKEAFTFYPNPVKTGEKIIFSKNIDFEILDLAGKVVIKKSNSNYFLTNKLSKGLYLISTEGKKIKFIVN